MMHLPKNCCVQDLSGENPISNTQNRTASMDTQNFPPLETDLALPYRLVPSRGKASGVLVLMHGVGSNELSMAGLATLAPDDLAVALVRSPIALGQSSFCAFRVEFTAHGPVIDAVEAESSRLLLSEFITQLQRKLGIAPARTLLAGFSQGGIMAAGLALTRPDLVAGFAIMSGRILREIEPMLASRPELARLKALIAHGEFDDRLPVSFAQQSEAWLAELGVPFESRRYRAGHQVTQEIAEDFFIWVRLQVS